MKTTTLIVAVTCLFGSTLVLAGSATEGEKKAAPCVSCHGLNGKSTNPNNPSLKSQQKNYLVKSLQAYRDKKREDPMMNSLTASLTDADIDDLATYYSSLK